jgi:hypothetical protein
VLISRTHGLAGYFLPILLKSFFGYEEVRVRISQGTKKYEKTIDKKRAFFKKRLDITGGIKIDKIGIRCIMCARYEFGDFYLN